MILKTKKPWQKATSYPWNQPPLVSRTCILSSAFFFWFGEVTRSWWPTIAARNPSSSGSSLTGGVRLTLRMLGAWRSGNSWYHIQILRRYNILQSWMVVIRFQTNEISVVNGGYKMLIQLVSLKIERSLFKSVSHMLPSSRKEFV